MILKNGNDVLELCEKCGSVLSYKINGGEFIAKGAKRPLFTFALLDNDGRQIRVNSSEAEKIILEKNENGCKLIFDGMKNLMLGAAITVEKNGENGFKWHIVAENNTGMLLEWIEFPQITVPDSLVGEGGDSELFWPALEGMLIQDKTVREKSWLNYREIGYQNETFGGFYPGSCPMQFMAYYNKNGGLYFAAHDPHRTPKTVEFHADEYGIALEYRLFCSGAVGHYDPNFDMVTSSFDGDWNDAAEIYRSWMQSNAKMPKKLSEEDTMPKWFEESPIVMIYPIKGTIDHGDMTPNMYYPYKNILPVTEEFSEKTNSRIMALPMHWEGTAPWATPYVWPPYGGEKEFCDFVSAVHEQGNLVGVYCSGIGWTLKSYLNPELDLSDKYDESLICRTPDNKIVFSKVIGKPIRDGYDMCPVSDKVGDIVSGEVLSIAKSGVDYAQYFDQNLGGESCICYARDHGHAPGPGVWQNEAMIKIFKRLKQELGKINSDMLIGCECAGSEPFIEYLKFSDLRYPAALFIGKPVPAYAYLFHEYLNNFMGNQCVCEAALDFGENPDCLLFRIGYSFAAGDLMTVILGKDKQVNWAWGTEWTVELPKQEPIFELIKNLNAWRKASPEFLHLGKMVKPHLLKGVGEYVLHRKDGTDIVYPSLLTTRWVDKDGKERQVVVNYLNKEQSFEADCSRVYTAPDSEGEEYTGKITVKPLSAVWFE